MEVSRLGHDRHRRQEADAADRLERSEQFDVGAGGTALEQGRIETPNPLDGGSHACQVVIEGDLTGTVAERQGAEPRLVLGRPRPAHPRRRHDALAEQELAEVVLGPEPLGTGVVASPDEIAQCLVGLIRDPHRGEVAAAEQPGELDGIALIRLHPVARPAGDQRRRHHLVLDAQAGELAVQGVAGRAGLVRGLQLRIPGQLLDQPPDRTRVVGDVPVLDDRAVRLGHRHCDRLLAHIQTDVPDRLEHGAGLQRCGSARGELRPPA